MANDPDWWVSPDGTTSSWFPDRYWWLKVDQVCSGFAWSVRCADDFTTRGGTATSMQEAQQLAVEAYRAAKAKEGA